MEYLSSLGGHVTTHLTDLGLEKEQARWINLAGATLAILHHVDAMAAVNLKNIFDQKGNDKGNDNKITVYYKVLSKRYNVFLSIVH